MRLIEARQRIQDTYGPFVRGKLWASGYLVAANGIDIINAFIHIPLPSWHWGFNPYTLQDEWLQWSLLYTRSRGWRLWPIYP
jgi:hypothetical protein